MCNNYINYINLFYRLNQFLYFALNYIIFFNSY